MYTLPMWFQSNQNSCLPENKKYYSRFYSKKYIGFNYSPSSSEISTQKHSYK